MGSDLFRACLDTPLVLPTTLSIPELIACRAMIEILSTYALNNPSLDTPQLCRNTMASQSAHLAQTYAVWQQLQRQIKAGTFALDGNDLEIADVVATAE